jgi:hypothetical protein
MIILTVCLLGGQKEYRERWRERERKEGGEEEEDVKNDGIACVSHMHEGGAKYSFHYSVCGTEC